VYINQTFIPGNSAVNPQATHVIGFLPFVVDITPYVKFGGSDNVSGGPGIHRLGLVHLSVFFGNFRFGQGDGGLFRPVWMHVTDKVHIPINGVFRCQ